jgi:nucleoside-diphosphate-sugar epimerase
MRKKVTLITGSVGEVGQALVEQLAQQGYDNLLTLDIRPMPPEFSGASTHIQGDIVDNALLARLVSEYEIETVYHLAALLSTRAEFTPVAAHQVNVEGTLRLLQLAADQSEWRNNPVLFVFPSSIAAYGIPDLETKARFKKVREWEWNYPITMYGCNKLYCEMLGIYFGKYLRQLAAEPPVMLDFRSVRFPGLISAHTVPSGGTSDYGPEMIHAAAQKRPYACFVRENSILPFMVMPDAVKALLKLAEAPREALTRAVYNVTSFSMSATEICKFVLEAFPEAVITFDPDHQRQRIVDSWPADLDDHDARRDWGWEPDYTMERAFKEYLIPNILNRYEN